MKREKMEKKTIYQNEKLKMVFDIKIFESSLLF